jgi:putative flippase GtrA
VIGRNAASLRFLTYSGVGVIAFGVDVLVFYAVLVLAGASPYLARLASFVIAGSAAWWLNRSITFRGAANDRPDLEWARFLALNLVGGLVNYATFAILIATLPLAATYPVLALAAGSLCGLSFNFTASTRYVFQAAPRSRG